MARTDLRFGGLVSASLQPKRVGFCVHYTANSLIRRQPILWHEFQEEPIPGLVPYQVLPSLSRGYA